MNHARTIRSLPRHARPGFTLVELLFSIGIIFLLMAIAIVAMAKVNRSSRRVAQRQAVVAIRFGVDQFQSQFGFLPPIIDDGDPLRMSGSVQVPNVIRFEGLDPGDSGDAVLIDFWRGEGPHPSGLAGDHRFSTRSLAFYLAGALDADDGQGNPVDGVTGPGFLTPRRDGSFGRSSGTKRTGDTIEPFIEVDRNIQVFRDPSDDSRLELRDANGTAFRFYRWRTGSQTSDPAAIRNAGDYNVPKVFGDADRDGDSDYSAAEDDTRFRSARYVILAAGPNGVFGDVPADGGTGTETIAQLAEALGRTGDPTALIAAARKDNVMEVGR